MSTQEQAHSGAGLAAQRAAIAAEAQRRGWEVVGIIEDAGYSAKDLKRPGIRAALDALKAGDADALVISKLDRLSRSLLDFAGLMAKAQRQSWGIIALDVAVDTTTPAGEAMASVLATFAQFERRLIGQRTREAIAAKRANPDRRTKKQHGAEWGRKRVLPAAVVKRIARERAAGKSLQAIADELNARKVPTAHGGRQWWPSTVRAVLQAA